MKFVTRAQWGARPAKSRVPGILSAASTIHWNGPKVTVSGNTVWDHSKCSSLVRGIQNFHMDSRGWQDVAYNFLECPHGYTFEGRGLNIVNGANGTNSGNRSSHAVCCLAGDGNPFPMSEKIGFRDCAEYISDQTLAPFKVIGHRDHKSTECPGNDRYVWVHKGMPVDSDEQDNQDILEEEDESMNEPIEIVKGHLKAAWYATDGVTKQWVKNREHAAILCLNRGARIDVKPASMSASELDKMQPYVWPQDAVDSLRLVGEQPPG